MQISLQTLETMSTSCTWSARGLDEARFRAFTKLLVLRSGRQVQEYQAMQSEEAENEPTSEENGPAHDGVSQAPMSDNIDRSRMKRVFLDRFAEIMAVKTGGHQVSATLLVESPDAPMVLVAKNSNISQDVEFLDTLERLMRAIASKNSFQAVEDKSNLWIELRRRYDGRLQEYRVQLRAAFKDLIAICPDLIVRPQGMETLQNHLRDLHEKLFSGSCEDDAINAAAEIRERYSRADFEQLHPSNPKACQKLRDAVCFLGRLKLAFEACVEFAENVDGCDKISLVPVLGFEQSKNQRKNQRRRGKKRATGPDEAEYTLGLQRALRGIGQTLDDVTMQDLLGRKWSLPKVLAEFRSMPETQQIHAEAQLILDLGRRDISHALAFGYIGCSKRSCYLCWHFLRHLGRFTTRGCHGKLYDVWTVPKCAGMSVVSEALVLSALEATEGTLRQCFSGSRGKPPQGVKESSVGGSVAPELPRFFGNMALGQAAGKRLYHERIRLLESGFRGSDQHDKANADDTALDEPEPIPTSIKSETAGKCDTCEGKTSRKCSKCQMDWFCSERCQSQMSVHHRLTCSSGEITSADLLELDCYMNEIPEDPQIREDYGFDRCSRIDQSNLLGLYQGLFKVFDVEASAIHRWRKDGELSRRIIEVYEKNKPTDEQRQGAYYPWFLNNTHLLDADAPPAARDIEMDRWEIAVAEARKQLPASDRTKRITDLQPIGKKNCFILFASALQRAHPPPELAGPYYDFGFPTCRDRHDEGALGHLYSTLIRGTRQKEEDMRSVGVEWRGMRHEGCSFDEFYQAYAKGALSGLFSRYGLEADMRRFQHLEGFLADTGLGRSAPRPSVWWLRHFLALDPMTPVSTYPEMEAGIRDYGFSSSLSAKHAVLLRELYGRLLGWRGDPMEVHRARSEGRLREYAMTALEGLVDGEVQVLLQNLPALQADWLDID